MSVGQEYYWIKKRLRFCWYRIQNGVLRAQWEVSPVNLRILESKFTTEGPGEKWMGSHANDEDSVRSDPERVEKNGEGHCLPSVTESLLGESVNRQSLRIFQS